MISFALAPKRVPAATASRNMSPVDICGIFLSASSLLACVPFPDPGAPSKTIRIFLSRNDSKKATGQMRRLLGEATGNDAQRQFDQGSTRDPVAAFRYAVAPPEYEPEEVEGCLEETRFMPSPVVSLP
jgi:hypothetical protein